MSENNTFYCSFVGNQYIICECGETFPTEDALRDHLDKDCVQTKWTTNQTFTEYKCGECGNIYQTEQECLNHQEEDHVQYVVDDHSYLKDMQLYIKGKKLHLKKLTRVTSEPLYKRNELVEVKMEAEPDVFQYVEEGVEIVKDSVKQNVQPVKDVFQPLKQEFQVVKQEVDSVNETVDGDTMYVEAGMTYADDGTYVEEHQVFDNDYTPVYISEVIDGTNDMVIGVIKNAKQSALVKVQDKPEDLGEDIQVQATEGVKKKTYVHKNVVCEICGKKYASNAALRYHQRVHTGVRPFQCPFCPKNFTMSLFLQIHIRTHTGERPYKCPHCPKAFSNRAALLRHDRVHTGAKPYECPKCGKFFTQSNSMKLHVHTVHMKMPAPYKSARRKAESRARAAARNSHLVLQDHADQGDQGDHADHGDQGGHGDHGDQGGHGDHGDEVQILKTEQAEQIEEYTEAGEVFYCDIPAKEEEVTYELIYE